MTDIGKALGHRLDQLVGGASSAAAAGTSPFILNGAIDLVTPSAANTYTGEGIIDGQRVFIEDTVLDSVQMYQRVDGATGSTTAELYRYTGGVWTEIALSGALTLAAGGGANAVIVRTFGPTTFLAGDRIGAMLTAVQARTPPQTAVPTDLVITPYEAP